MSANKDQETIKTTAVDVITKYFEYNSNVGSSNSCDIDSLCNLMVDNVKVDYPSFQTNGDSSNDLNQYKAHVTKSLGVADSISKHRVYPSTSDGYQFEFLSNQNDNHNENNLSKDEAIIQVQVPWTYEMEWIGCVACMFKYVCCCIGGTYTTTGTNTYRLKYDSNKQLKICYVQTVTK